MNKISNNKIINYEDHFKLHPLQKEYFESLSIKEKKACIIAKEHLETSFQLEKSVGYLSWLKNKK